jgi:hypothetical protein
MLSGYRTIIAAAVALIAEVLQLLGVDIAGDQTAIVNGVLVIGGAVGAIVFRFKATKTVGGKPLK